MSTSTLGYLPDSGTGPSLSQQSSQQSSQSGAGNSANGGLVSAANINFPTATFPIEEFRAKCNNFLKEFDTWVMNKKEVIAENRQAFVKQRTDDKDQFNNFSRQIEILSLKDAEVVKIMEKERREVEELQTAVNDLNNNKDSMTNRKQELENSIEELKNEIKRKRAALDKKKRDREILSSKCDPELAAYEEKLAMKIIPLKSDVLEVSFTHINEKNWEETFSFVFDVSDQYKIMSCKPMLPNLDELVNKVNDDRQFYVFLKMMRKGFVDLVKSRN